MYNTKITGSLAQTRVGDVGHASLHQEDGLDTDGDQNSEKHSAGAAVVGNRKSFEQVFSEEKSIWVRRALSIPGDQVWHRRL